MTTKTRGHWPKGRRRNKESSNWLHTLDSITELISNHRRRGSITFTALAKDLDVDQKTVYRWFGIDAGRERLVPDSAMQAAVKSWLRRKTNEVRV